MKTCCFCGSEFTAERPYDHCTDDECVTRWKHERRANQRVMLLPKQGFTFVDLTKQTTVDSGKSSGR